MANHRIYRYTSLARPPNPAGRAGKVVLYLLPAAALLGAVMGWLRTASLGGVAEYAAVFTLVLYGAWALARELDPDDSPVSFISMALGLLAALLVEEPGVFVVYVTIALVRMVNRSSGLEPRHSDSFLLMLASIGVIYHSALPLFGLVAGVAFALDGSLKKARPSQWVYGLVCIGATVVYMVDHDVGLAALQVPDSLFEWLGLLFIVIFALEGKKSRFASRHEDKWEFKPFCGMKGHQGHLLRFLQIHVGVLHHGDLLEEPPEVFLVLGRKTL